VVLILAWGSTFASIKVSLEGCPPMLLAGGRCVIGGALIALVAIMPGGDRDCAATWVRTPPSPCST
jgi:hypothetical protein